jgi:tape measure domain-containing protein
VAKLTIQIGAKIGALKKGLANGSNAVQKWSRKVSGFTKAAFGAAFVGVGAGIGALIRKSARLAAQFEQIKVAFTTMVGSADKAKGLIAELNEFSKATPFSPDQVFKAGKTLLAFGFEAKNVSKTLKLLGDVSAGTGKDLGEMAVIFGQIKGAGRLMGQDLLQLINAGFNPLQVISKKTGKSMAQLKEEMSKGLITFDQVEGAFKDATSEGGLFFNMMEKQAQTLNGQLSTLDGAVGDLMRNFGEGLLPELKSVTAAMLDLAGAMGEVAEARKKINAGDVDAEGGMATVARLYAANLSDFYADILENLPGESALAVQFRKAAEAARDKAMGGIETQAVSRAQREAGKKKVDEARKESFAQFLDGDFGGPSDDQVSLDMSDIEADFNKQLMDVAKPTNDEASRFARQMAIERQDLSDMQDRAGELQKTIGVAFQPGGKIQSRLARIGGERTINVDRQIPLKQLEELQKLNKAMALQTDRITRLDFQMRFPEA